MGLTAATAVAALLFAMPDSALAQAPPPAGGPAPAPTDGGSAPEFSEEAEVEYREQIRVYQQKPFMKKLRFELAPVFGLSVNDPLIWQYSVGATGRFHIDERFSIAASYRKYFHSDRDIQGTVEDAYGVYPEIRYRDWYAGGDFAYVPLYGKFIIFDAIVQIDGYLTAGAGAMRTWEEGTEGDTLISWNIGVGARFIFTEWLALNFELRDYMYIEPYRSGDSFINDVVLQTGLSFFFPVSHDYQYPK